MHKCPQISRSQTPTRPLLSCTLTLPLIIALLSSAANAQVARTPAQAEDEALALYGQALQLEGAGQDEAARPRVMRALEIAEHELGLKHPGVPILLQNVVELGKRFDDRADYARAEQFYQRAMTISVQARGTDNPDMPTFLNNLGTIYQARGQHVEALRLFTRALALTEKFSGADSPDVALQLNNAADSHIALGEYAQARAL